MSREGNARRLAQIKRRLDGVTLPPPPWAATLAGGVRRGDVAVFPGHQFPEMSNQSAAEFTAAARDDVPWLVARVEQLERVIAFMCDDKRDETGVDLDPVDEE